MQRREFFGIIAAGTLQAAQPSSPGFVTSEVAPLKRVLVHAPGPETRKGLGLGAGHRFLSGGLYTKDAETQHAQMVALLKQANVEVLTLQKVLDDAIAASRAAKAFEPWLRGWAPQLAPQAATITALGLLGGADELIYRSNANGDFAPLTEPLASFTYVRDSAVMTPRGVILCGFSNEVRSAEAKLMRFAYEWSPQLKKYPILFDASEEQTALEGGDILIFDANTLLMGVGNRTAEDAAPAVARKTGMDVIAVQMPPAGTKVWNDQSQLTRANTVLLHLDTVCTLVNRNAAVAVPFLMEKKWEGKDPLTRMLKGIGGLPRAVTDQTKRIEGQLKEFGKLKRFKGGSGSEESMGGDKLVDFLQSSGYSIIPVGGQSATGPTEQYMTEFVVAETKTQGGNTLALAPGSVIAFQANTNTNTALLDANVKVGTFLGTEFIRTGGGPHCLTQPLERA